jgi:hypothetical protein
VPTTVLSPEVFRREAERRLIDRHDLMVALGLRSKQAIQGRVERGTLPRPIFSSPHTVSLWDADEIQEMTGINVTHTDREES